MSIARYDGLIRFDADDLMLPNMVEEIMKNRKGQDIIRFRMKNFGMNQDVSFATGQVYIRHTVFDEFGGYRPWVCAADTDFKKRLTPFVRVKMLNSVLMRRRVHEESLTRNKKTDKNSKIRTEYTKRIAAMRIRNKKDAIIEKETNTCKEIFGPEKEAIRILIEPKKTEAAVKPAAKTIKKKPSINKGKPATRGWSEFFGFV